MATCPECEFDEIDTEDFEEGDTLSCPECGKSLVMTVISKGEEAQVCTENAEPCWARNRRGHFVITAK